MTVVAELFANLGLIPDEASWDRGKQLIDGLHHALEVYLGYEGLNKVKELITGTVEAAQEAKNLGERLGITATAVQELGYAAYISDVSAGELNTSMMRLSRGLEQLKTKGTGPAADALRKLGVNMRDLKGESLDQNIEVLAEAFHKAGPAVNKTAVAMELFGRQGSKMLLLLNKGKAGIVDLRNEAEKLGVVMGGDALEKADEFEASQKRLHSTLLGLRNQAVIAVLPSLQAMVESMQEWVVENREAIASGLQAFLEGLAGAFRFVGKTVYAVIEFLREHEQALFLVKVAMGVYLATLVYTAAASALQWAIAFWPLTLGAATIASIVLTLKDLYEYITGEKLTLEEMWDGFLDGGRAALDWLEDLPSAAGKWIGGVADAIKEAFKSAWDFAVRTANEAWDSIKGIPVIGQIVSGAEWLADQAANEHTASNVVGGLQGIVSNGYQIGPGAGGGDSVTHNSYSIGDVHVKIDAASMSPDEIKDAMKDSAGEAFTEAIRKAHHDLSGGKR